MNGKWAAINFFSLRLEGIFKGKIEPKMLLFLALRDRFRLAPINPQVGRRHKSIGVKRMVFWEQLETIQRRDCTRISSAKGFS